MHFGATKIHLTASFPGQTG